MIEQIGQVDAFVGAVGIGRDARGRIASVESRRAASARIVALEPSTSPFLTTGKGGAHRVEGTAAGFWPPHLVAGCLRRSRVPSTRTTAARWRVARRGKKAIFAGTSTGLNLVAALDVARELGPGKIVATVAVDTGLKYLAGDLYK